MGRVDAFRSDSGHSVTGIGFFAVVLKTHMYIFKIIFWANDTHIHSFKYIQLRYKCMWQTLYRVLCASYCYLRFRMHVFQRDGCVREWSQCVLFTSSKMLTGGETSTPRFLTPPLRSDAVVHSVTVSGTNRIPGPNPVARSGPRASPGVGSKRFRAGVGPSHFRVHPASLLVPVMWTVRHACRIELLRYYYSF